MRPVSCQRRRPLTTVIQGTACPQSLPRHWAPHCSSAGTRRQARERMLWLISSDTNGRVVWRYQYYYHFIIHVITHSYSSVSLKWCTKSFSFDALLYHRKCLCLQQLDMHFNGARRIKFFESTTSTNLQLRRKLTCVTICQNGCKQVIYLTLQYLTEETVYIGGRCPPRRVHAFAEGDEVWKLLPADSTSHSKRRWTPNQLECPC